MRSFFIHLFGFLTLASLVFTENEGSKSSEGKVTFKSARLEVKAFLYDHADLYKKLEVKYIGGADPELIFVKQDDSEERIPIDELSTKQICNLLDERGFVRSENGVPIPDDDDEGMDEDGPGVEDDFDDMREIRENQIPMAPGVEEDEAMRPGPLTPEEEQELEELMKKQEL